MKRPATPSAAPRSAGSRQRSPSYPFISLERAAARAREYALIERRHSARVGRAVTHWGYKPSSSGGQQTVAALVSYGIMEDVGRGELRKVQLTDLGWQIVNDTRSEAPNAALQRAALTPRIFSDLWTLWRNALPDDAILNEYLIEERGYTAKAANAVIALYRENLSFTRLDTLDMVCHDADDAGNNPHGQRRDAFAPERPDANEEIILTPGGHRVLIKFSGHPSEETYRFLRDYMDFKAKHM